MLKTTEMKDKGFRLKMTLQPIEPGLVVLPIDYQYALGCSLYNAMGLANNRFTSWLHQKGYGEDNKRFKFFTYSGLHIKKYSIDKNILIVQEQPITFKISAYTPEIADNLVIGFFKKQFIEIADRKIKAAFQIDQVELLPGLKFREEMTYRLFSPCVISYKTERGITYYSPESTEIDYAKLFMNNLINKYLIASQKSLKNSQDLIEKLLNTCHIELLTPLRSKLITIKWNTPQETKVRGFLYTFKLKAPAHLHRIGYYAGFGEKNSLGFGWAEVVS
ncbi:MAG: CRISPR-associated endoribonuclease Cas6 [Bacteroidales bacterium]